MGRPSHGAGQIRSHPWDSVSTAHDEAERIVQSELVHIHLPPDALTHILKSDDMHAAPNTAGPGLSCHLNRVRDDGAGLDRHRASSAIV
jgi:hypothetical protein